jgi:hypothetical protein
MTKPTSWIVLVVALLAASSGCDDRAAGAEADKASKDADAAAKSGKDAKVTVDPNGNVQVQTVDGNGVSIDGAQ